uniref:Uncharacterized protein n=1 Tax=Oryza sativa subsp. japonica TaxID=39947 RepID=Q6ZC67_ORYSJ|nr:hypothetical protein [Oryza sativa Japonica Group]
MDKAAEILASRGVPRLYYPVSQDTGSSGKPKEAIEIFKKMCRDGVEPDVVT